MKKIGFIGVGIMGKSMVRNLKKAGFDLHIYARTKAKVEDVIAAVSYTHLFTPSSPEKSILPRNPRT